MKKQAITILILGDIFGKAGREAVRRVLPSLRKKYVPDLIIANAENLAHGYGVTEKTIAELKEAGISIFTSGNHILNKPEGARLLNDPATGLIRPLNYPGRFPGKGYTIIPVGNTRVFVLNLVGTVFMKEEAKNPFREIRSILKQYGDEEIGAILVDFHAEATSEKVAMGHFLDGKVSLMYGTHTHVQTADERILENGMGYITDVGMTGMLDSVIGLDKEIVIKNFITGEYGNASIPESGRSQLNAVVVEINTQTKKTESIIRIHKELSLDTNNK